jgi:glutathione S-transferase
MLTFFSYNISPYAAKVRAVLRYKQIPFEERVVHPLDLGDLERRSGRRMIPVIEDDGDTIVDSTRIIASLDERYPQRPVIPRDPAWRARALLLEELADEGLVATIQPVRWFIPANARRTTARFRSAYPRGLLDDLRFALISAVLRLDVRRKCGSRTLGAPSSATILARLAELLDVLDAALVDTGWLAGPSPSVADFAVIGWLDQIEGLDGWDLVQSRPRVARLLHALSYPSEDASHADDDQPANPTARGGDGSPASRTPT